MIHCYIIRLFRPRTNTFVTVEEHGTHENEAKTRALFKLGLKDWEILACTLKA